MKERKKQAVSRRNMVLAAVILSVLLVSFGSIALAAPAPNAASQNKATMIDPFMIQVITVSGGNPVNIQAVSAAVHITPRKLIRVPVRPPLRSAFQPVW